MGKKFTVRADDWKKYCYAVGDYNPIHWDTNRAKSFGLEEMIAPGMFVASHIQGDRNITGAKIKFYGNVYDGDRLIMEEKDGNYVFKKGDDVVCEVKGVSVEDFSSKVPKPFEAVDILHKYSPPVGDSNIVAFLESLGMRGGADLYGMYLASLSAPALLDFGKQSGFVGIHASQTFTAYGELNPGFVDILIGRKREKAGVHSYELQWKNRTVDGGALIASGKAMVVPLLV